MLHTLWLLLLTYWLLLHAFWLLLHAPVAPYLAFAARPVSAKALVWLLLHRG